MLELFQRSATPHWGMWTSADQAQFLRRWTTAMAICNDRSRWLSCHLNDDGVEEYRMKSSHGRSVYSVTVKGCNCPSAAPSPWGWCKHRLAVWIDSNRHRANLYTPEEMEEMTNLLFGQRRI